MLKGRVCILLDLSDGKWERVVEHLWSLVRVAVVNFIEEPPDVMIAI